MADRDTIRGVLHDIQVGAQLGVGGVRWLGDSPDPRADGDALRALIRACYGETYACADRYRPGVLEAAWQAGQLVSLGRVVDGELVEHTGLFLGDATAGIVVSGMTMMRPGRPIDPSIHYGRVWAALLDALRPHARLMYQNTTTLHAAAQVHALEHMHARPCGLIVQYTTGERVAGLRSAADEMHALRMVTRLGSLAHATAHVPRDSWGEWLASIMRGLELRPIRARRVQPTWGWSRDTIEERPALGLRRERLVPVRAEMFRMEPPARIVLRHVPADDAWWIAAVHPALLQDGYVPVGVQLNATRAHELVYQWVGDAAAREDVARRVDVAALASPALRDLWTQWRELCAHTS